jgi:sulfur carrier protein
VKVSLNGRIIDVTEGWSVGDLVRANADERRRVAVARNGEVVPRVEWDGTKLADGDVVEVLAPVAGG